MSKLTDRAEQLEEEGNLEVALNYYEMALGEKSCPFDVRKDFGRVLNKLGNYKDSQSCFDLILSMDEGNIESWFGKGISFLGLNNWEDALSSFKKVIELDTSNANAYYYAAIILKEFESDESKDYYSKFQELDNDEFQKIREFYEFGLIFTQREFELENNNKHINIEGFHNILLSYDLGEEVIYCYLRTCPLDKLKEIIISLNDLKYENDEKRIILDELMKLGLDKEDVEDLFVMESIENLKNKVVSKTGQNPFPDKENPLNIPIYIEYNGIQDSNIQLNAMPINIASEFNEYKILDVADNKSFIGNLTDKIRKKRDKNMKLIPVFNNLLKRCRFFIDENNYEKALSCFDPYPDFSNIPDLSLRINCIFYKASLLAKVTNEFQKALEYFEEIEVLCPDLKYNSDYLFNKGNSLYDNGNFYLAINSYNDSLVYNNDNVKAIFFKTSAYYKLSDFRNALKTYNELSDMDKDEDILNNIKNQLK